MKKNLLLTVALSLILILSSCSKNSEQTAFHEAQNAQSIELYEKYLNDYPKGKYVMEAKKQMEDLTFDKCETIFDYENYLKEFPEGKYADSEKVSKALMALEEVNKVLTADDVIDMQAKVAATTPVPVEENELAVIETNFGKMVVKLFPDVAPGHAANFKRLTNSGYYNGTKFHRIIPNFVIQGGDILSRDADKGNDGTGDPGYNVPAEFNKIHHKMGILSMARAQHPDSAGSQFFVCAGDVGQLDNNYTVFGEVIEGLEVIEKIVNQPRDARDNPLTPISMYVYMISK